MPTFFTHTTLGKHAFAQQRRATLIWTTGLRVVSADQQHLGYAGFAGGALKEMTEPPRATRMRRTARCGTGSSPTSRRATKAGEVSRLRCGVAND